MAINTKEWINDFRHRWSPTAWKDDMKFLETMTKGEPKRAVRELPHKKVVAVEASLMLAVVALGACNSFLKDQNAPQMTDQTYSPSGEIVPINMFGQDTIFYTAQPAFAELGLSARQVEVVQLGGSDQYTALQLMEIQDKKGEIFYNLMFQNKNGQVQQEWAVLLADSPQSPESVLYQLDLVSSNGHNEFVANMAKPLGNLTPTQLQISLPGETGIVPVPTADLMGLFTGVHPVLAADESTSTPVATIAPTPKPTETLTPFPTPTEFPTITPFPSNTPVRIEASPTSTRIKITPLPPTNTPVPPEAQPTRNPDIPDGWPNDSIENPPGSGGWFTPLSSQIPNQCEVNKVIQVADFSDNGDGPKAYRCGGAKNRPGEAILVVFNGH